MTTAQLRSIIREELEAVKKEKMDEISIGGVDLNQFIPLIGPMAGAIGGWLMVKSNMDYVKKQLPPNATEEQIKAAAAKALVDTMQTKYGGSSR